jgi:hypothetical protein
VTEFWETAFTKMQLAWGREPTPIVKHDSKRTQN